MGWLVTFIDRLFIWVPRCILVRLTHGGVKWRGSLWSHGLEVIELKPGLFWYWPLVTDYQLVVVARQPVDLPTMSLLTCDGKSIVISASVIFRVNNVILAIAERNWDADATTVDITQNVIFDAVRIRTLENLRQESNSLKQDLTETAKNELKKFGIHVERVLLKDFDVSKTYRILGDAVKVLDFVDGDE